MAIRVITLIAMLIPIGAAMAAPLNYGLDRPSPRPDFRPAPAAPNPVSPEAPPTQSGWQAQLGGGFSHLGCLVGLLGQKVDFTPAAPVTEAENPACGIARPVRVAAFDDVAILGEPALMQRETALALALWLRGFVQPAAAELPGRPKVTALAPGSVYQCRQRVGDGPDDLSEHALGNAFDIMAFQLDNGDEIAVVPDHDGDKSLAFLATVRGAACLFFTTVLGPGSDSAHGDHLHLDIKQRQNGWRLCQ